MSVMLARPLIGLSALSILMLLALPPGMAAVPIADLAGRWEGTTSAGQAFVWIIDRDGTYRSETATSTARSGVIRFRDGRLVWSNAADLSGALEIHEERGDSVLKGTIEGRSVTFEARRVARGRTPTPGTQEMLKIDDDTELLRVETDQETQIRFSLLHQWSYIHPAYRTDENRTERVCRGYWIPVVGEAPSSMALSDEAVVQRVVEKAKQYAFRTCPKLRSEKQQIWVMLYPEHFDKSRIEKEAPVFARFDPYTSPDYSRPREDFRNRVAEEAQRTLEAKRRQEEQQRIEEARRREAENRQQRLKESVSREFITRTVEDFSLGTGLDDAFAKVVRGLRERRLEALQEEFSWGGFLGRALEPGKERTLQESLLAKGAAQVGPYTVPVASLRPVRTANASKLVLRFYRSRLFVIVVEPHAAREVMHQALVSKYGSPLVATTGGLPPIKPVSPGLAVWWRAPGSVWDWKGVGSVWEDSRSVLEFLDYGHSYTLIYHDKATLGLVWQEAVRQQKEAEEREQERARRQRTLPKQY